MAQLLCVLGRWERALTQLDVAAELDALALPMKQVYGDAIRCEGLRAEVFAGRRTPLVLGEPPAWLALLIESLRLAGSGDAEQAEALRAAYFDDIPHSRISEMTGLPLGTIKSRIRLGLERLRHELRTIAP